MLMQGLKDVGLESLGDILLSLVGLKNLILSFSMKHSDAGLPEEDVRVLLELKPSVVKWIDALREEWGLRSRGAIVSILLDEIKSKKTD